MKSLGTRSVQSVSSLQSLIITRSSLLTLIVDSVCVHVMNCGLVFSTGSAHWISLYLGLEMFHCAGSAFDHQSFYPVGCQVNEKITKSEV